MAEIGEGKVLLFGGSGVTSYLDDTWIYDYQENNWTQINNPIHPIGRDHLSMARITKNKVLLFGGQGDVWPFDDTWIFDLETLKWTEIKPLNKPSARYKPLLSQLSNNKVVLVGGVSISIDLYENDTWVFDFDNLNWEKIPLDFYDTKTPKSEGAAIAQIDSGKVVFFGGWDCGGLDNTYLFNENTEKWKYLKPKDKPPAIHSSSMANIRKNQIVLWGGNPAEGYIDSIAYNMNYDQLWLYNLNDSNWIHVKTPIHPKGRCYHNIVNLGENRILLFGGGYNDTWVFTLEPNAVLDNQIADLINQNSFLIQNNKVHITTNLIGICNYKLYDIYGKVLKEYSQAGALEQESSYIDFDASDISNGVYFLVVQGQQKKEIIRLMVAR